mgnify:CR=1 FL=1
MNQEPLKVKLNEGSESEGWEVSLHELIKDQNIEMYHSMYLDDKERLLEDLNVLNRYDKLDEKSKKSLIKINDLKRKSK